jgi:hypothetical protein
LPPKDPEQVASLARALGAAAKSATMAVNTKARKKKARVLMGVFPVLMSVFVEIAAWYHGDRHFEVYDFSQAI